MILKVRISATKTIACHCQILTVVNAAGSRADDVTASVCKQMPENIRCGNVDGGYIKPD